MPRMTNGIGHWFCRAGFDAGWGWDDAVECIVFLYLPVWPLRAVHVRDVSEETYEALPIHMSKPLIRQVFLRRWSVGAAVVGAMVLLLFVVKPTREHAGRTDLQLLLGAIGAVLVLGGLFVRWRVQQRASRERDRRSLLGLHHLGNSDPLSWVSQDSAGISSQTLFGTPTFAEAVPGLLRSQAWSAAAWASRLSAKLEGEAPGEQLTNDVINEPAVAVALAQLRRRRDDWHAIMGASPFQGQSEQS